MREKKKPLSHGNMPVWTTKVVLSHPQTSQELFQFHAQNNTAKQPQRFSHTAMKWTCWSRAWPESQQERKAWAAFLFHGTPPTLSTQWHQRSLQLPNGPSDQDWWSWSSVSTITAPHALPSAQLGWVIGCRWGGDHCWADCGNTSKVYGTEGAGERILPIVSLWRSGERFFQKRSPLHWLRNCARDVTWNGKWQQSTVPGCETHTLTSNSQAKAKTYIWLPESQDQLAVVSR